MDDIKKNKNGSIFIMRHTQAKTNASLKISAKIEGFPLTKKGISQAEKIGKNLKDKNIDLIFSSPVQRCRETAQIISKIVKKPVIFDERLREINPGIYESKSIIRYTMYFKNEKERFYKKPHGGESREDVKKRVADFYNEIIKKYPKKNILIISHGDPLRLLQGVILGLSDSEIIKRKNELTLKIGEVRQLV
ncbi:MAG: histidine phosphatase family protein [Candidatus Pacebacteria bacterium]|nr:histidine phosphatase family protein [Candidatus Paceibacterota bacterium]